MELGVSGASSLLPCKSWLLAEPLFSSLTRTEGLTGIPQGLTRTIQHLPDLLSAEPTSCPSLRSQSPVYSELLEVLELVLDRFAGEARDVAQSVECLPGAGLLLA